MDLDLEQLVKEAIRRKWDEYYRPRWIQRRSTGRLLGWNFSAFFFGWIWLAYRQLYLAMAIEMALIYGARRAGVMMSAPALSFALALIVRAALGLLGNHLLFWTIERDVKSLDRAGASMDAAMSAVSRKFQTAADKKLW